MSRVPKSTKFLYLGVVSERAAQKYGDPPITLDHDMEAFPEVGQKLKGVSFIRKRETAAMRVSYVHSRMYLGLAVLQT